MQNWRARMHEVIFEADTRGGKAFDVALLMCIIVSILVVMLESVGEIEQRYGSTLRLLEWTFTILFSIEYIVRLMCVKRPLRYAFSFFGIVDLAAVVPTYLSVLMPGAQSLLVIRVLRLLRVFRVLKLVHFVYEAAVLRQALTASRRKITVFLGSVLTLSVIMGSVMYLVEGPENGFNNIPVSMYWAIVTLTTVGYGDIAPATTGGKFIAGLLMIFGYSIIAVPTGIVSVELAQVSHKDFSTQACPSCAAEGHDKDAKHCKYCGVSL